MVFGRGVKIDPDEGMDASRALKCARDPPYLRTSTFDSTSTTSSWIVNEVSFLSTFIIYAQLDVVRADSPHHSTGVKLRCRTSENVWADNREYWENGADTRP